MPVDADKITDYLLKSDTKKNAYISEVKEQSLIKSEA